MTRNDMAKKTEYRIRCTSKGYPKVDVKQLAKALGADSVTGPLKIDELGREYFEFEVVAGNKDYSGTKRIYKLSDEELEKHKLIGEAEGQDFFFCLFMGRHAKNFHNRVCGYQVLKPTQKGMETRVAFYEKA